MLVRQQGKVKAQPKKRVRVDNQNRKQKIKFFRAWELRLESGSGRGSGCCSCNDRRWRGLRELLAHVRAVEDGGKKVPHFSVSVLTSQPAAGAATTIASTTAWQAELFDCEAFLGILSGYFAVCLSFVAVAVGTDACVCVCVWRGWHVSCATCS